MTKKFLFGLIIALFTLGFLFVAGEITLRLMGHKPWQKEVKYLKIEPKGPFFEKDEQLGYKITPGKRTIWLAPEFSFSCDIDTWGYRLTEEPRQNFAPRPEIWITGCSYTFGWGIDDSSTFCWKVNEKLPNTHVKNFGVPGYSNIQNLIDLENHLKTGSKPEKVILVYAGFHDMRNVVSRSWQKVVAPYSKLGPMEYPKGTIQNNQLVMEFQPIQYKPWFLQQSTALGHFLEKKSNESEDDDLQANEVSQFVIERFHTLCKEYGIEFILATIVMDEAAESVVAFVNEKGIKYVDITVDLRDKTLTNEPYDSHPNGKAHSLYTKKLTALLK